ncbi:MAG: helix-hairpin-helix domain-containing protein [Acutalibacteraceae bacterium]|nr:helix-hairpin-helix domain-containing protein [Acutalibacteraceae bacterium]
MRKLTEREKRRARLSKHEVSCLIIALCICVGLLLYSVFTNAFVIPVNHNDDKTVSVVYKSDDSQKQESKPSLDELATLTVNINTADKQALTLLYGIGQSKAQAIIDYREQNGNFKTIEQILEVPGIKDKTFEKIKDNITVD